MSHLFMRPGVTLLLALCACTQPAPTTATTTVSSVPVATAQDARVSPTPEPDPTTAARPEEPSALLARWHPDRAPFHDVFDWGGGFYGAIGTDGDDAILLLARRDREAPADAAKRVRFTQFLGFAVSRSAALDLDGDNTPEILLWPRQGELKGFVREGENVWALNRAVWMLAGAANVDQVRAKLPLLRGYTPPAEGVTPLQVLLSMRFATDEQLAALIHPSGVDVCEVHSGNYRPHMRRCQRTRPAQINAAWLWQHLLRYRSFGDREGENFRVRGMTDGSFVPNEPECSTRGNRTSCAANMGGPGLYVWVFEGSGAALRLREIAEDYFEES